MWFFPHAPSRWTVAALLACALAVGGCGEASFSSWVMSYAGFRDVNLANGTEREVAGRLTVTDSDGSEVLAEPFRLTPGEGGVQFRFSVEGDSSIAVYENVFAGPGAYRVSVELAEQVGGTTSLEQTVEIDKPDDQRVIVAFGRDESDSGTSAIQVVRVPE